MNRGDLTDFWLWCQIYRLRLGVWCCTKFGGQLYKLNTWFISESLVWINETFEFWRVDQSQHLESVINTLLYEGTRPWLPFVQILLILTLFIIRLHIWLKTLNFPKWIFDIPALTINNLFVINSNEFSVCASNSELGLCFPSTCLFIVTYPNQGLVNSIVRIYDNLHWIVADSLQTGTNSVDKLLFESFVNIYHVKMCFGRWLFFHSIAGP